MTTIKTIPLLILLSAALVGVQNVAAQSKSAPQTVTDYYMLLSADAVQELASVKNRRSAIKIEDVKNGYLRIEGGWEGWAEIGLFRKTNREAVIAVGTVGCGPECSGGLQFLVYKKGKWSDVTAEVMPEIGDEDILAAYNRVKAKGDEPHSADDPPNTYWQLPRRGTTISLLLGDESSSNGKTLMHYDWNGERFVKAGR